MTVTPHLSVPFRISPNGSAVVLEQNSVDEIAQCVAVLMRTQMGERIEVPEYGVPDQPFLTERQAKTEALSNTIERWEPRAEIDVESSPSRTDENQRDLRVTVRARADVRPTSGFREKAGRALTAEDFLGAITWGEDGNVMWDQP